ncbi:C-C motif chemokine 20 [Oncorhynchus tshawytscha]|uniref:Chemokine interleukin-8-like domain-containing protein n=1 Tax=Oncorhynchus kisutch TaxID=8019 RepID=A0A8C7K3P5_ONCKI|nr:C-C motif chemokine 20 isoform X2 [Oncorhynchus kisutch]XP_024292246.1 C-C motif chemokine 20 [Oncorhynchus tshawytscha]
MASRYLETILLLCCIVTMFSSTSAAYGPRKLYCCVEFQEKPVPYTQIIGYKQQSYKEVCNNDAIIFYTTKNKKVCASIKDEWVRTALVRLSSKLKKISTATL